MIKFFEGKEAVLLSIALILYVTAGNIKESLLRRDVKETNKQLEQISKDIKCIK